MQSLKRNILYESFNVQDCVKRLLIIFECLVLDNCIMKNIVKNNFGGDETMPAWRFIERHSSRRVGWAMTLRRTGAYCRRTWIRDRPKIVVVSGRRLRSSFRKFGILLFCSLSNHTYSPNNVNYSRLVLEIHLSEDGSRKKRTNIILFPVNYHQIIRLLLLRWRVQERDAFWRIFVQRITIM